MEAHNWESEWEFPWENAWRPHAVYWKVPVQLYPTMNIPIEWRPRPRSHFLSLVLNRDEGFSAITASSVCFQTCANQHLTDSRLHFTVYRRACLWASSRNIGGHSRSWPGRGVSRSTPGGLQVSECLRSSNVFHRSLANLTLWTRTRMTLCEATSSNDSKTFQTDSPTYKWSTIEHRTDHGQSLRMVWASRDPTFS